MAISHRNLFFYLLHWTAAVIGSLHKESRQIPTTISSRDAQVLLKNCPEVAILPPDIPLPPLECWALDVNHRCYCFSPAVLINISTPNGPEMTHIVLPAHWNLAQMACASISMEMVAIETQDENEILSKHINDQIAISKQYWTSGIYSPGQEKDFVWTKLTPTWAENPPTRSTGAVPFEHTNWAKDYPLDDKKSNNYVLLNCAHKSCKWENHDISELSGILCEAGLEPSFKIPNVTRKAVFKDFSVPSSTIELVPINLDEFPEMTILGTQKPITKNPKDKSSNGNSPESFNFSTIWIAPFLAFIRKHAF